MHCDANMLIRGRPLECVVACLLILGLKTPSAVAEQVIAAVATNFIPTFNELVQVYESSSPYEVIAVPGSTGRIYAQIKNGAPFEIFLSADTVRPKLLEAENAIVPNSRFLYAKGRLALWALDEELLSKGLRKAFETRRVQRVAIANPALAPYGSAAIEVIRNLGLEGRLEGKIIFGDSVGQSYAHVATGNAELGFVPLSYVKNSMHPMKGFHLEIPQHLYTPVRQEAVLLRKASGNPAVETFYEFLQSSDVRTMIEEFGYKTMCPDD